MNPNNYLPDLFDESIIPKDVFPKVVLLCTFHKNNIPAAQLNMLIHDIIDEYKKQFPNHNLQYEKKNNNSLQHSLPVFKRPTPLNTGFFNRTETF